MHSSEVSRPRTRMRLAVLTVVAIAACLGHERSRQFLIPPAAAAQREGAAAQRDAAPAYRLYVTNELSGDLSIVDGASHKVIRTVPLGKRPRGIQLSPDGRLLYVALSGSPIAGPGVDESKLPPPDRAADGIGVFDIASSRLVRTLRGVSDPEQLAVSADGTRLYVASEDAGVAEILDAKRGTAIATLKVGGEPEGVARAPGGDYIYMSSEADHSVAVIDTATNRILKHFTVGLRPRGIAFSPDGSRAFVTGENDASLTVVATDRHEPVRTVHFEKTARPMGIVVSPDNRTVYVATGRGRMLLALDARTFEVKNKVEVGVRPWNIALSPDGRYVFTANGPSNDITVVDARSFAIVRKVEVGSSPWGIAVVTGSSETPTTSD